MEAQRRQAWYARINANRVGIKCHYYQVNDNVCFEYWNKHEWEFSLIGIMDDEMARRYTSVITAMAAYMHTINVSFSRIPALLSMCKARLQNVDSQLQGKAI